MERMVLFENHSPPEGSKASLLGLGDHTGSWRLTGDRQNSAGRKKNAAEVKSNRGGWNNLTGS